MYFSGKMLKLIVDASSKLTFIILDLYYFVCISVLVNTIVFVLVSAISIRMSRYPAKLLLVCYYLTQDYYGSFGLNPPYFSRSIISPP